MIYIFATFVFVFGVIIGSFLNVVALRYKTGRTVGGRSFCFSCGKTLKVFELIPVLSFLFQKGKCRSCKTPLSWQYPLVEIITGLVFMLIYFKSVSLFPFVNVLEMPFYFIIFSLLIVVSVYDIRHKVIPDFMAFIFATLSLMWVLLSHPAIYFLNLEGILNLFAGLILFVPFFLLWLFSKGQWMGLGDGKLVIGIGTLLGFSKGVSAVIWGFWIAAFFSLFLIFIQRFINIQKFKMKSEIPFAPFLVLGTLIAYYFSSDLLSLNVLLFG